MISALLPGAFNLLILVGFIWFRMRPIKTKTTFPFFSSFYISHYQSLFSILYYSFLLFFTFLFFFLVLVGWRLGYASKSEGRSFGASFFFFLVAFHPSQYAQSGYGRRVWNETPEIVVAVIQYIFFYDFDHIHFVAIQDGIQQHYFLLLHYA